MADVEDLSVRVGPEDMYQTTSSEEPAPSRGVTTLYAYCHEVHRSILSCLSTITGETSVLEFPSLSLGSYRFIT